jgi:(p)ppGpp synthase/HD superfamily hydrolase
VTGAEQSAVDGAETLQRAIEIAVRAHAGQLYPARDGERGPYVLHLFRVMLAVDGWEARTTAVLHDVIEDTPVTAADLHAEGIPDRVVDAVLALTHREEDTYEAYVEALAPNPLAREVKLADLADNLATNLAMPPTPANEARIARYEAAIARLGGL